MSFSNFTKAATAASLGVFATSSAFAHGDSGGGGGVILPAGTTLVVIDYDVTKYREISDARLTALALQGVAEVHSLKTIRVPALTLGYGLTRDLTLSVRLPYLHNQEIRETDPGAGGVAARGGVDGFGDASFTGTYRLYNNEQTGLEAAVIFGVKAPTGRTSRLDNFGERFETEHQPGSGSWDGIIGGTLTREIDHITVAANALYQFNGEGTAETTLGDHFGYGVTASYRLWSSDEHSDGPYHLGGAFDGMMHHGGPDDGGHAASRTPARHRSTQIST